MSKTRNLSDLLDANGDVKSGALDNVPASNDASALTTGTLPNARLSAVPNSALANSSITINGSATNLGDSITVASTDASDLTSGTLANARLPANISDSGTEGTKVATGTTAQRGSTVGQIRYNTTTNALEYRGSGGFFDIDETPSVTSATSNLIVSASGGTTTVTVNGDKFVTGMNVKAIGTDNSEITADSVSIVNRQQLTAVFTDSNFNNAVEPYGVKVINPNGKTAEISGQLQVDTAPTFTTASGNVADIGMSATGTHVTLQATDAEGQAITFSEVGNTLLSSANLTINSDGTITGDPTDVVNPTTYNFTARATAGTLTNDRAFNIIVRKDYADVLGYSFVLSNTNGDTSHTINVPSGTKSVAYVASLFFNNGGKQVISPVVGGSSFTQVGGYYSGNSTYGGDSRGFIRNHTLSGNTSFICRTNNTSGHNYKMGGLFVFFDLEFANTSSIHASINGNSTGGTINAITNGTVMATACNDGNQQGNFSSFDQYQRSTGDNYRHYTNAYDFISSSEASSSFSVSNGAGNGRSFFAMSFAPSDFTL